MTNTDETNQQRNTNMMVLNGRQSLKKEKATKCKKW